MMDGEGERKAIVAWLRLMAATGEKSAMEDEDHPMFGNRMSAVSAFETVADMIEFGAHLHPKDTQASSTETR